MTLDSATPKQGGVELVAPQPTHYQEQVRAYGTVLDLDKLVTLENNYMTAGAQVKTAQAKLVASRTTT